MQSPLSTSNLFKISILAGLATLLSPGADAGEWAGRELTVDGERVVQNPATPIEPIAAVELEELWRIGGDTDDEDEFFGVITSIETDDQGNIYLLDAQLSEIKIFSSDGGYVNTIGREGEGPGEFRRANTIFFLPGGELGVLQIFPARIVKLQTDGTPAGLFEMPSADDGGPQGLIGGGSNGDYLVLACFRNQMGEGEMTSVRYLSGWDGEGNQTATYHSEDRLFQFANATIDENVWDTFDRRWQVADDGRVYAVTRNGDYAIRVWNSDGSFDREIRRESEPYPRSAAETERVRGIYEAFTRQVPGAQVKLNDFHRGIEQLYTRGDGSLWVLTSRGTREVPDGAIGTFDVFDSEGRFGKQVTLMGQGNPLQDGYFFVEDRLYVVTGFLDALMALVGGGGGADEEEDTEPMAVICYKLDPDMVAMK